MKLLLFMGLIAGSVGLSFIGSHSAFAQSSTSTYFTPTTILAVDPVVTPPAAEGDEEAGPPSTCKIEGIGWILCPVVREMAKIVDGAYAFVSSLLAVQPLVTTGKSAGIYTAWSIMRNFANVAFVIAFLVIIFSQLTSVGLNNYGIKKMLPRLIIAAILVNASFWICAVAVDVSNILGSSVNSLFQNIAVDPDNPNCKIMPTEGQTNCMQFETEDEASTGTGWAGIAGLVLAGTGITAVVLYATFAALLPALLAAILAIVTVFLVLTMRQALIILLIVVSPLAFVAYLLPNTESLYKKWLGLFKTLLLMYPIISGIFGASALASVIVMQTADPESQYRVAIQIMGAAISIIPLALTPIVMKTAGGLLNRFGGIVNNPNKGPFDKMRKKAEGYRDYRQDLARGNRLARGGKVLEKSGAILGDKYSKRRRAAAALTSLGATNKVDADKQKSFAKAVADETGQEYFAKRALNQEGFANKITGDPKKAEGLKASAQSAVDKIIQQDAANREILYTADVSIRNNPRQKLEQLLASQDHDEVGIKALGSMLMKGGASGYGSFNDAVTNFESTMNPQDPKSQAKINDIKKFVSDNGKDFKAKDPAMLKWAKDVAGYNTLQAAAAHPESVTGSDQEVASVTPDALRKAAQHGNITVEKARAILSNPDLANATSDNNKEILRAVIATNGQAIAGTGAALKAEITRQANNAPTVEQIQQAARQQPTTSAASPSIPPQPTQAPTIQYQTPPAAPGTLNIQHTNTPTNATPGNYRTSPPPNQQGAVILNPTQQPPNNTPQGPRSNNP